VVILSKEISELKQQKQEEKEIKKSSKVMNSWVAAPFLLIA